MSLIDEQYVSLASAFAISLAREIIQVSILGFIILDSAHY